MRIYYDFNNNYWFEYFYIFYFVFYNFFGFWICQNIPLTCSISWLKTFYSHEKVIIGTFTRDRLMYERNFSLKDWPRAEWTHCCGGLPILVIQTRLLEHNGISFPTQLTQWRYMAIPEVITSQNDVSSSFSVFRSDMTSASSQEDTYCYPILHFPHQNWKKVYCQIMTNKLNLWCSHFFIATKQLE